MQNANSAGQDQPAHANLNVTLSAIFCKIESQYLSAKSVALRSDYTYATIKGSICFMPYAESVAPDWPII